MHTAIAPHGTPTHPSSLESINEAAEICCIATPGPQLLPSYPVHTHLPVLGTGHRAVNPAEAPPLLLDGRLQDVQPAGRQTNDSRHSSCFYSARTREPHQGKGVSSSVLAGAEHLHLGPASPAQGESCLVGLLVKIRHAAVPGEERTRTHMTRDWEKMSVRCPSFTRSCSSAITNTVLQEASNPAHARARLAPRDDSRSITGSTGCETNAQCFARAWQPGKGKQPQRITHMPGLMHAETRRGARGQSAHQWCAPHPAAGHWRHPWPSPTIRRPPPCLHHAPQQAPAHAITGARI